MYILYKTTTRLLVCLVGVLLIR